MACRYYLRHNGVKEFGSEYELNMYLLDNMKEYVDRELNIRYSLDNLIDNARSSGLNVSPDMSSNQADVFKKIVQHTIDLKSIAYGNIKFEDKDTISTSNLVDRVLNRDTMIISQLVKTMIEKGQSEDFIVNSIAKTMSASQMGDLLHEASDAFFSYLYDLRVQGINIINEYGLTDPNIREAFINTIKAAMINKISKRFSYEQNKKVLEKYKSDLDRSTDPMEKHVGSILVEALSKHFLFDGDSIQESSEINKIAENMFDFGLSLVKKFSSKGIPPIFIPEQTFVSKNFAYARSKGEDQLRRIEGRMDLVVIDQTGKISIVDIKSSFKNINDYDDRKNATIYAQQRIYAGILSNLSISSEIETYIAPIKVDYDVNVDKSNISRISNTVLSFDKKNIIVETEKLPLKNKTALIKRIEGSINPVVRTVPLEDIDKLTDSFMSKYFPSLRIRERGYKKRAARLFRKYSTPLGDGKFSYAKPYVTPDGMFYKKYSGTKAEIIEALVEDRKEELEIIGSGYNSVCEMFTKAKTLGNPELIRKWLYDTENRLGRRGMVDERLISKYLNPRYDLIPQADLARQGILLFSDTAASTNTELQLEVVVLSDANLDYSITTDRLRNKDKFLIEDSVGRTRLLANSNEHLIQTHYNVLGIAALHALMNKKGLFENKGVKLKSMEVMNPIESQFYKIPTRALAADYDMLRTHSAHQDKSDIKPGAKEAVDVDLSLATEAILDTYSLSSAYSYKFQTAEARGFSELQELIDKIRDRRNTISSNKEYLSHALRQIIDFYGEPGSNEHKEEALENLIMELEEILVIEDSSEFQFVRDAQAFTISSSLELESSYIDSPSSTKNKAVQGVYKSTARANASVRRDYVKVEARERLAQDKWFDAMDHNNDPSVTEDPTVFDSVKTDRLLIGKEEKFFKRFYRTDADGNILPTLILKTLDDDSLSSYDKEYLRHFLRHNYVRMILHGDESAYNESSFVDELSDASSVIYYPPLIRKDMALLANAKQQYEAGKKTLKTVRDSILRVFGREVDPDSDADDSMDDVLVNNADYHYKLSEEAKRNKRAFYNHYAYNPSTFLSDRVYEIDRYGVDMYDMNLHTISLTVEAEYIKEKRFNEVLPSLYAIKDLIERQAVFQNMDSEETTKWIDDYIKQNVLNISLRKNKSAFKAEAHVKHLQSLVSKALLGGSIPTLTRDVFEGLYRNFSDALLKSRYGQKLSFDSVRKGYSMVLKDLPSHWGGVAFIQALNEYTGMSNFSISTLVDRTKSERGGINSVFSRWMTSTASGGDYLNRMSLLMANMVQDGVVDAISFDEVTSMLQYDIKKDARFSVLFDKSKSSTDEYKIAMAKLRLLVEDFNRRENADHSIDDVLTGAVALDFPYTDDEVLAMRNAADTTFGFFDKADRMRINNLLLGSLFLHFGTYLSAAKDRWFGASMISEVRGKFVHAVDEEGRKIYKIYSTDENGEEHIEITTNGNQAGAEAVMEWHGDFMEGILVSLVNTIQDFVKGISDIASGKPDGRSFKELWASMPEERKNNLKRLGRDLAFVATFWQLGVFLNAALASPALGYGAKVLINTVGRGAVSAGTGMVTLGSIVAKVIDPNIPSISYAVKLGTNSLKLLSGKVSLAKYLTILFNGLSPFLTPEKKIFLSMS